MAIRKEVQKLINELGKLSEQLQPHDLSAEEQRALASTLAVLTGADISLEDSAANYDALWSRSQNLICLHNSEGVLQGSNAAAVEFFGYSSAQLHGKRLSDLIAEDGKAMLDKYLADLSEIGRSSGVMKIKTPERGIAFWAYESVVVRKGSDPAYVVASGFDMTNYFVMEEELESSNRIAELNILRLHKTLRELEDAKKKIDISVGARQRFIATISHELRNPLNVIVGNVELLRDGGIDQAKAQEQIKSIQTSSDNMMVLVNDLLELSKIEAGMLTLESTCFEVQQILSETFNLFKVAANDKQLDYELHLSNQIPPQVKGDPHRLRQILSNLIGNAIKFTTSGSVLVNCEVVQKQDEKCHLEFSVVDTGIGIPKDKQALIFDPFVQASAETTRNYGGTGLGLTIVKNLVDLQQGNLEMETTLDEGTTFRFVLPYELPLAEEELAPKESEEQQLDPEVLSGKRILLAEDNQLNQKLTVQALQSVGCEVLTAENGRIAIDTLKHEVVDLILMDIRMPEMDGVQATQHLRNEMKVRTPIVALSASTKQDMLEDYNDVGFDAFLSKPFRRNELLAIVGNTLTEHGPQDTANLKLLDLQGLYELGGDDESFVHEMLGLFKSQNRESHQRLHDLLAAGDIIGLGAQAHKMRTSYHSLGIQEGGNILESMEKECKREATADKVKLTQHLNQLKEINRRALREINTILQKR